MSDQLIYVTVFLTALAAGIVIVARAPATAASREWARLTLTGRLKVASLALLVRMVTPPMIRLIRYPKGRAGSVTRLVVPTSCGDARVDLYRPVPDGCALLPVHFNVHGGGFVVGNLSTDAPWCNYLCDQAQCIVINIDYALAPKHTFPAPVYQCHEVIHWATKHANELGIDIQRMSIGGDSAGGNLAIAVALLAIERKQFALRTVVPGVPVVDLDSPAHSKSVSTERKQELTVETIQLVQDVYVPRYADRRNPLASPLFSKRLAELPSVFIVSAELDLLHSDAVALEEKLREIGGDVGHITVKGADHGFLHVGSFDRMLEAWDAMVAAIVRGQCSA